MSCLCASHSASHARSTLVVAFTSSAASTSKVYAPLHTVSSRAEHPANCTSLGAHTEQFRHTLSNSPPHARLWYSQGAQAVHCRHSHVAGSGVGVIVYDAEGHLITSTLTSCSYRCGPISESTREGMSASTYPPELTR